MELQNRENVSFDLCYGAKCLKIRSKIDSKVFKLSFVVSVLCFDIQLRVKYFVLNLCSILIFNITSNVEEMGSGGSQRTRFL